MTPFSFRTQARARHRPLERREPVWFHVLKNGSRRLVCLSRNCRLLSNKGAQLQLLGGHHLHRNGYVAAGKPGPHANALAPGYFRTELNKALVEDEKFLVWLSARTPLGRWGDAQELVGAAIFLASDASSICNGHAPYFDGGVTAWL